MRRIASSLRKCGVLIVSACGLFLCAAARGETPLYLDPGAPVEARIDALLAAMTLDEKIKALGTDPSVPRLGLRLSGHIEGLHGVALGGPGHWGRHGPEGAELDEPLTTTQFPQAVGLGETWDPEVVRRVASIEAEEARYAFQSEKYRRGGLVVRAPNADLARDPRWGRTEESYGEDPFLTGTLASAFVHGLQGDDPRYWEAASLLKHFMANSNEDTRDHSSSNFDQRLMREYYSVPFRMAITQGGARAFMAAYNAWNGIPMAVHPILRSMAVGEWGEDGIICTDGGAMTQLVTSHKRYATLARAAAAALHAGINQFLDHQEQPVRDALQQGLTSPQEIDARLRGVYRDMIRLGLLDPPAMVPYAAIGSGGEPWLGQAHRQAVREVTRKSIVLLKNSGGLLPLQAGRLHSIAVIGPYADRVLPDWYGGTPPYTVSPLEGIRRAAGPGVEVRYAAGGAEAVRLARTAEVAIVLIGNHPTCDAGWAQCPLPSNGKEAVDRKSITLEQEALAKQVYAVNPRTVVVLVSNFPYAINWTQRHVPAILHLTHASQEQGSALADVLFGDYDPAGRLVQTWPSSLAQLPPMMDYDIRHGRTYMYFKGRPLYPFGYGLSYTRFEYSGLSLGSSRLAADGMLDVSFQLRNAGPREGEEVVQLYVQYPDSKVSRPERALKAFARVPLAAYEFRTVHLQLQARDLAWWDESRHRFTVEAGRVRLLVGASSADIRLRGAVSVDAE